MFNGLREMKRHAAGMVLQSVLMVIVAVVLIYYWFGVTGAVIGIVLSSVGSCTYLIFVSRRYFKKYFILSKNRDGDMGLKLRELPANEEIHKLMIAEVVKKFGIAAKQGVRFVKEFPDFIEISKKYWLMCTDAIHVATMKKYRITNIATNDPDFERVEWLKVWKPQ